MKNPFSLNNIIKILVIVLLAIPLIFFSSMVALFVYSKLGNKQYVNAYTPVFSGGPTDAYSASTATATQFDPVTASPAASSGMQSTYLPGVRRPVRAYNGPLDDNGVVPTTTPGWWLYAYSAEEAAWLDKHGYPTPAEDQRLRSSSQQELKQLMELGDKNARAWLAAKAMKNDFSGMSEKNTGFYVGMDIGDLELGNPYQSIVIAKTYMDLRTSYYEKLPDRRTEQETKTLGSLSTTAEYAWHIANVQGDTTMDAMSMASKWGQFGLIRDGGDTGPTLRAESIVSTIFSMQRRRPQAGMPLLDFEKRPTPIYSTNLAKPTQVLERY
jgi:hypothetical protein